MRDHTDLCPPSTGRQAVAFLQLSIVHQGLYIQDLEHAQGKGKAPEAPDQADQDMSAWRLRYALMLTDSLSSILFDARRNTCHCLLLNYWVRCGGLEVTTCSLH